MNDCNWQLTCPPAMKDAKAMPFTAKSRSAFSANCCQFSDENWNAAVATKDDERSFASELSGVVCQILTCNGTNCSSSCC